MRKFKAEFEELLRLLREGSTYIKKTDEDNVSGLTLLVVELVIFGRSGRRSPHRLMKICRFSGEGRGRR